MRTLILVLLFIVHLMAAEGGFEGNASADTALSGVIKEDFADEFDDEFDKDFGTVAAEEIFDPLSGYNRVMTDFNDMFYTNLVFPVARGYRYVVPEEGRLAFGRFFDNLHFPVRFVNNVLQLKLLGSGEELARFMINSTIGLFGLFDPAEKWFDLKPHKEDFGQTLGYYGVGGGFHIVLPIFGPSNLRDTIGMVADWYVDPTTYWEGREYNLYETFESSIGIRSFEILNESSFNDEAYESLKKDAVDLYPFFRNIYNQKREKAIAE